MDVLKEILNWSQDRPKWQRDALRRLVLNGELDSDDIDSLTEICKSEHGLSNVQQYAPLEKKHLPTGAKDAVQVNLLSIYHHHGVNALAENQELVFGSGLTVVYGDNAAGKSGYTRIIKSACRARGPETILGNVLSGSAPLAPSVSIKYTKNDDGKTYEWAAEDESISRVSVFDSHSAAVYLTEKTDVAFRPFGLDLFDKLSRACQTVRTRLESNKRDLGVSQLQSLMLPEGTAAATLVNSISSLTDPEKIKALGKLSDAEQSKLQLLEKQLIDLQANDPKKASKELSLRATRLRSLIKRINLIDHELSEDNIKNVFEAQHKAKTKRDEANRLRDTTFPVGLLKGTGSDNWSEMWEAARSFSNEDAYAGQAFPVTQHDACCVLCQQTIQEDAATRLTRFEEFVASVAEKELRQAIDNYTVLYKSLDNLDVAHNGTEEIINDIRIEDEILAREVESSLEDAKILLAEVMTGLNNKQGIPKELPKYNSIQDNIELLIKQLEQRALALQKKVDDVEKSRIENELKELKSRETLGKNEKLVLSEVERKKKLAAYGLCLDDTKTQAITLKSTAVTKIAVTQQLKQSFKDELANLNFKHVEVELKEAGGDLGNLYHKLILTRAPGVELPKVVSEGEARCLSIAAFFAELSTADDPSAIIFDDPVSSLDYKWRGSVARRLVEEAKTRQVILFTHDIVFLLALHQYANEEGIELLDQHVRQLNIGAGVCQKELPWVALSIKKRIGFLKNTWQSADKLFRDGHIKAYEKETSYIYGLLREAWERALEEVLLDGVVERYRTGVQTQHIGNIADITVEDCKELDIAISKCSKWLPGHDQAPAAKEDIPEPDELKSDIESLETWVTKIRKRR